MKVSDMMTTDVEVLKPETPIQDAAEKMRQLDAGAMPVVDGERVVGVLTDRDIAVRFVAEGRDFSGTTVADIMSRGVISCGQDDEIAEAERIMEERQVRRLIVLDSRGHLAGILSLCDIADRSDDTTLGHVLRQISLPGESRHAGGGRA